MPSTTNPLLRAAESLLSENLPPDQRAAVVEAFGNDLSLPPVLQELYDDLLPSMGQDGAALAVLHAWKWLSPPIL
jgi:hypothetical protein